VRLGIGLDRAGRHVGDHGAGVRRRCVCAQLRAPPPSTPISISTRASAQRSSTATQHVQVRRHEADRDTRPGFNSNPFESRGSRRPHRLRRYEREHRSDDHHRSARRLDREVLDPADKGTTRRDERPAVKVQLNLGELPIPRQDIAKAISDRDRRLITSPPARRDGDAGLHIDGLRVRQQCRARAQKDPRRAGPSEC